MKFSEVRPALRAGKKIKLDTWKNAYWYINQTTGMFMNHFEDGGNDIPVAHVLNVQSHASIPIVEWVANGNWEVVGDETNSEPKNSGSGVKEITKERYDQVVMKVIRTEIKELEGSSKLLIPMVGMIFERKIADELFGTEQADNTKEGI